MPDLPTQTPDDQERRYAIGVTRVCLASGTLQVPFAMRGILEPGTYLAHDRQLDETHELVFEPPRSLQGLDALFVKHDLHPNDEVILTVADEGLELEVAKRPRRKAPQAKGEPWESVRGAGADRTARAGATHEHFSEHPGDTPAGRQTATADDATVRRPEPSIQEQLDADDQDPDAPRMVRARRRDSTRSIGSGPQAAQARSETPTSPAAGRARGSRHGVGAGEDARGVDAATRHEGRVRERGAPASERAEPTAETQHAAKRFYEESTYVEPAFESDELSGGDWSLGRTDRARRTEARDVANEGDELGGERGDARSGEGFFAKIARTMEAARGALSFRGAGRETEQPDAGAAPERQRYVPTSLEDLSGSGSDRAPEEGLDRGYEAAPGSRASDESPKAAGPHGMQPRGPERHGPEQRASEPRGPEQRGPEQRAPSSRPRATGPARSESPGPGAASTTKRHVVVEDVEADTMDQHGPPMWDLGEGDLRQRLTRFLRHPDVPVILRTETVARNFGLGQEVADAMLEDLTNDKIEGLVVTKVRDETYRISRAPAKL